MLQYCAHPEPHEEYCVQLVPHPEEHDVLPEQRFTPQDTATPHIVEQLPSLHLPKQLPYSLKQAFKLYYEVCIMIISIESSGLQIQIEDDKNITLPAAGMQAKHGSIFEIAEASDAWVSADYHFGKWLRKEGEEADKLKAEEEKIIELHNAKVGKDDIFLFLGDIAESEFGDEFRPDAMDYVVKQVQRLNGRKILLTGNNDTCDNAFYKKCGFEDIFRRDRIVTDKHVFSHFPVNMRDGTRINLHGHTHGSFVYYECDPENHIDVYWKLWNGPLRISELDNLYKEGKYKGHLEVSTKSEGNDITL